MNNSDPEEKSLEEATKIDQPIVGDGRSTFRLANPVIFLFAFLAVMLVLSLYLPPEQDITWQTKASISASRGFARFIEHLLQ